MFLILINILLYLDLCSILILILYHFEYFLCSNKLSHLILTLTIKGKYA